MNKSDFGILQREGLAEKIASQILSMIRERKVRPGDRLPPERELASMMKVSRPSLREALRALSLMGIIDRRQGSGTRVASLEPSRLIEHFDLIFSLEDAAFLELFQARKILEVGLAGLAADRITDEELRGIEDILKEGEDNIDNSEDFSKCDIRFHEAISQASGNRILSIFMASVAQLNLYSRRRTGELADVRRHTRKAHRDIFGALAKHDHQKSEAAMLYHLSFVESRFAEISVKDGKERK